MVCPFLSYFMPPICSICITRSHICDWDLNRKQGTIPSKLLRRSANQTLIWFGAYARCFCNGLCALLIMPQPQELRAIGLRRLHQLPEKQIPKPQWIQLPSSFDGGFSDQRGHKMRSKMTQVDRLTPAFWEWESGVPHVTRRHGTSHKT